MNYRIIFHTTGKVLLVEAGLLALPLLVSVLYHERCAWAVLASMAAAAVIGGLLTLLARPRRHTFFNREGYIIVALAWVLLSAVGALPFWFSREIPSYADAFFETVSGFTTTGASILTDVEAMSHGLLFWRSFTHWVGGMGVLVFITMISGSSDRSMNILKAEMPGPVVGKLTPRTRDTARVLYLLYFLITTVLVGMLLLGGMPLFDSLVHAFGTVGTGGFGIKADSIASYSPYIQGVITVFMILCGINFNLYYLLLLRQWRSVLRSDELWTYLGLVVVATGVITLDLRGVYGGLGTCLRQAAFQVGSVITTTGYATADFNVWPGLSRAILFALMFIGGCAGSTAGGLKVSRAMILLRTIRRRSIAWSTPGGSLPSAATARPWAARSSGASASTLPCTACVFWWHSCASAASPSPWKRICRRWCPASTRWAPRAWGRWVPPEAMRTIPSCQSCCCPWPCSWAGWRSIPCWWRCPPPSGARIKKKKLCINHMLPL